MFNKKKKIIYKKIEFYSMIKDTVKNYFYNFIKL